MAETFNVSETVGSHGIIQAETLDEIRLRLKSEVGNNTEEAIFELEKELRKDSRLYSEFLICKNKYKSISAEHHMGTISDAERNLQHSKLLDTLLTLIDRVERKDLSAFRDLNRFEATALSGEVRNRLQTSFAPTIKWILKVLFGSTIREIATSLLLTAFLLFQFLVQPRLIERRIQDRLAEEKIAPRGNDVATLPPPVTNSYAPADFEILERRTIVDLRGWTKVPLQLMKTDRFEPMFWHQSLKILKKGESKTFVATHFTDGYTIDFACISPECIKRAPVPVIPKDGAAKYSKYDLEFDVSKYVINQEFEIEYKAIYWNANQKTQWDSMTVIARNPTRLLIFEIHLSEFMEDEVNFRWAEESDNLNYHKFDHPLDYTLLKKHLTWRIQNPRLNIYHGVQWKWKTQMSQASTTLRSKKKSRNLSLASTGITRRRGPST